MIFQCRQYPIPFPPWRASSTRHFASTALTGAKVNDNERSGIRGSYSTKLVHAGPPVGQVGLYLNSNAAVFTRWGEAGYVLFRTRASRLYETDVYVIHAIEDAPAPGVEPLEWMLLLSSVPTTSFDEALERLAWYARRWAIETWHRILKSGCRVEARQFGTLERFVRPPPCLPSSPGASCTQPCRRELARTGAEKCCCNRSNGKRCIATRIERHNCLSAPFAAASRIVDRHPGWLPESQA